MEKNKLNYEDIKEIAERYGIGLKKVDKEHAGFIIFGEKSNGIGVKDIYDLLNKDIEE